MGFYFLVGQKSFLGAAALSILEVQIREKEAKPKSQGLLENRFLLTFSEIYCWFSSF